MESTAFCKIQEHSIPIAVPILPFMWGDSLANESVQRHRPGDYRDRSLKNTEE